MVQVGDVLTDRYELKQRLGSGGMAEVFRATDDVLARDVAVKVLAAERARDEGFIKRFRREARSAAALNHRNVVGVHDTGSDDGAHYIVMELVDGPTLEDVIHREGRLDPQRAIAIAQGICSALEAAHERDIVHRDIKPGNIMFDAEGAVKVTDFGLARAAAEATQTATVYGSAPYMSPEQARGDEADPRTDIYALGCVLYVMLTGAPPFEGESALAIVYQHLNKPPTPPSEVVGGVPEHLEQVILKALEKSPEDRYQEVTDLHEDLNRVAAGRAPLLGAAGAEQTRLLADTDGTQAMGAGGTTRIMTDDGPPPAPARDRPTRGSTSRSGSRMLGTLLLIVAAIAALVVALLLIRGMDVPPVEEEVPEEVEEPEEAPAPEEPEPEPEPEEPDEEPDPPDDNGEDPPDDNGEDENGEDPPPDDNGEGEENGEEEDEDGSLVDIDLDRTDGAFRSTYA